VAKQIVTPHSIKVDNRKKKPILNELNSLPEQVDEEKRN
jgi:hypothetical protein